MGGEIKTWAADLVELVFDAGDKARDESWVKLKVDALRNYTSVERCDFTGTRAKTIYVGGDHYAEFIDCTFDRTSFGRMFGSARFIDCTFRGARLTDFASESASYVGCDFSGATIRRGIFWGRPSEYDLSRYSWMKDRNDISANDFSGATMVDSDFRRGVDLSLQQLPVGPDYAYCPSAGQAIDRVGALVDSGVIDNELDQRVVLSRRDRWRDDLDQGQTQLFVCRIKFRDPALWDRLRETIIG